MEENKKLVFVSVVVFLLGMGFGHAIAMDDHDSEIALGKVFANATCIEKGLMLDKITEPNGLPMIVCKNVSDKVDWQAYEISTSK